MANVEKFSMCQIGHVCAHFAREHDNYSNESIDEELTWTNYNLAEERDISQVEFIKQKLDETVSVLGGGRGDILRKQQTRRRIQHLNQHGQLFLEFFKICLIKHHKLDIFLQKV